MLTLSVWIGGYKMNQEAMRLFGWGKEPGIFGIKTASGIIHLCVGVPHCGNYPTAVDMTIPARLVSLIEGGKKIQIVENPKKEFLKLGGPGEVNFEFTPKPVILCHKIFPSEVFVDAEYYPDGEGPLVEAVRTAIRQGAEINRTEPKYKEIKY